MPTKLNTVRKNKIIQYSSYVQYSILDAANLLYRTNNSTLHQLPQSIKYTLLFPSLEPVFSATFPQASYDACGKVHRAPPTTPVLYKIKATSHQRPSLDPPTTVQSNVLYSGSVAQKAGSEEI